MVVETRTRTLTSASRCRWSSQSRRVHFGTQFGAERDHVQAPVRDASFPQTKFSTDSIAPPPGCAAPMGTVGGHALKLGETLQYNGGYRSGDPQIIASWDRRPARESNTVLKLCCDNQLRRHTVTQPVQATDIIQIS